MRSVISDGTAPKRISSTTPMLARDVFCIAMRSQLVTYLLPISVSSIDNEARR
jgi:hypothetical protein